MELVKGRHYLVLDADGTEKEAAYTGVVIDRYAVHFCTINSKEDIYVAKESIAERVKDIKIDPASGVKYSSDKPRWDLLPMSLLEGAVKVLSYGAKKYADNNWMNVLNGRAVYYAALQRHLEASEFGVNGNAPEEVDPESGLDHLDHAICCLLFLKYAKMKGIEPPVGTALYKKLKGDTK